MTALTYALVHLELDAALGAKKLVGPRGGQGFGALGQEQEVVEEEGPQFPAALGLVQTAAVQQLARSQAIGE